jgi:V/A-type H+-transporting ATPase subunit F
MEKKVDIAAIGDSDTILLFNAIGIRTYSLKNPMEIDKTIYELVNEKCKIIYVTEEVYTMIPNTIEKYKSLPFPVIIPIPSGETNKGIGMKKIKENVEKAIGFDIF